MFASGSSPSAALLRGRRKTSLMFSSRRFLRASEKRRRTYEHWKSANLMFEDCNLSNISISNNDGDAGDNGGSSSATTTTTTTTTTRLSPPSRQIVGLPPPSFANVDTMIVEEEEDIAFFKIPISCRRQLSLIPADDEKNSAHGSAQPTPVKTTMSDEQAVDQDCTNKSSPKLIVTSDNDVDNGANNNNNTNKGVEEDDIVGENLTVTLTLPTSRPSSALQFHRLSENKQKKQEYFSGRVTVPGKSILTAPSPAPSGSVNLDTSRSGTNEKTSTKSSLAAGSQYPTRSNTSQASTSKVSFATPEVMEKHETALATMTSSAPSLTTPAEVQPTATASVVDEVGNAALSTLSRTLSQRGPRRQTSPSSMMSVATPSNLLAGLRRLRPIVMRTIPSEREQMSAEHTCPPGQCRYVRINVSGLLFELCATYLDRHPKTLFGDKTLMASFWEPRRKEYFFDRHRPSFEGIFAFLKYGDLPRKPDGVPDDIFLDELYFFRIEDDIIDQWKATRGIPIFEPPKYILKKEDSFFRRLWFMFEVPAHSRTSYALNIISVVAAIVAVCCLILESMPNVSTSHCLEGNRPNFGDRFFIVETVCTSWFTLELLVRIIGAPAWRDLVTYQTGIDIAANTPYFVILISVLISMDCSGAKSSASTGFLRIFRLFSIFKLSDRSGAFALIANTFKASTRVLTLFFLALAVCVVLFGSFIYIIEAEGQSEESPQSEFQSIADGFWWATITMTTVGYGDLIPRTVAGKIVGSCCAIVGVITLSMPIPILTENFNKFYKQMKKRKSMTT